MAAASEGENGGGGQRGGGGGKRGEKTISAAAGEGKNGGKGRGNQPTEFQPETNSRTHASMEQITSFESSAVSFQPSAQDRAFVVGFWQKAIRNYASLFDDNTEIAFVSSPWRVFGKGRKQPSPPTPLPKEREKSGIVGGETLLPSD